MDINEPLNQLAVQLLRKSRDPDLDGYKPLPYQIDYHKDTSKGRIVFGGNRSGKTYSSVVEMIWWATGTHPYRPTPRPPVSLRHVAVDSPQGINKVLKELYRKIAPPRVLRGGSFEKAWQNVPTMLYFENGSFIEFLSYEQELDKHAGTSRHAVAFDEEPGEAIFNENMARLIDTDGEWWISLTPLEGLSWLYTRYQLPYEEGELSENVAIYRWHSRDNSYLPVGAIDRLLEGLSNEERKARLTGEFIALSGLIFQFQINTHVRQLAPQSNLLTFTTMDHGLRNPTAWLWIQVDSDGTFYVVREHYKSELLVKEHALAVKLVETNRLLTPSYRVGDPSIVNRNPETGQSVHSEYALHGINIAPGNNDVNAGINRVASLFHIDPVLERPRIFIDAECRHLIKELRTYRWDEWATRKAETSKEPKTKPKKMNDHAVDALRYGVMTRPLTDTGRGPIRPTTLPEDYDGRVLYATPTLAPAAARDWRDGSAYDFELGSEW